LFGPEGRPGAPGLPPDVEAFIVRHIDSVEQLEVLLLLQASAGRVWTAEEVAQALYSTPASVSRRLEKLRGGELLAAESGSAYRYRPATPELDQGVVRLAETYRERRVAVITLIASRPMDNVRAFSDAFRLGRKES
jgi:hypothetical protein